jgi:GTP-binding protein EngB required for normal cell division
LNFLKIIKKIKKFARMEEADSSSTSIMVVFGRTGTGKSTLGNRLLGGKDSQFFKESDKITSETKCTASEKRKWVHDNNVIIQVVDTPGFGDNRPISRTELLGNTFKFLKELKAGFNIGILCINANSPRVDGYEIDDFVSIGRLLGNELFNHSVIALTQSNLIESSKKASKIKDLQENLPKLFVDKGLKTKFEILDAGWDNYDEFTIKLNELMKKAPRFKSKTLEQVDLDDPKAVEKFLTDPKVEAFVQQRIDQEREKLKKEYDELKSSGYASKEDLKALLDAMKTYQQPAPVIIQNPPQQPVSGGGCNIY